MALVKILGEISDFNAFDEFEAIHENRSELEEESITKSLKRYLKFNEAGLESSRKFIYLWKKVIYLDIDLGTAP